VELAEWLIAAAFLSAGVLPAADGRVVVVAAKPVVSEVRFVQVGLVEWVEQVEVPFVDGVHRAWAVSFELAACPELACALQA
jgi:hypothetical protein